MMGVELALEGEIVDGHDGGRPRPAGQRQIGRGEPRLPVVGMDEVGPPPRQDAPAELARGPGERCEAPVIVGPVVPGRILIEAADALEEMWCFDQEEPERAGSARRQEPAGSAHEVAQFGHRLLPLELAAHLRVGRHEALHLTPQGTQSQRQGPRHVGQPARLDQREQLGSHREDAHGSQPRSDLR